MVLRGEESIQPVRRAGQPPREQGDVDADLPVSWSTRSSPAVRRSRSSVARPRFCNSPATPTVAPTLSGCFRFRAREEHDRRRVLRHEQVSDQSGLRGIRTSCSAMTPAPALLILISIQRHQYRRTRGPERRECTTSGGVPRRSCTMRAAQVPGTLGACAIPVAGLKVPSFPGGTGTASTMGGAVRRLSPLLHAARRAARIVLRARLRNGRDRLDHLRTQHRLLRRSDREEAAQPVLSRHAGPLLRHAGLQPGLQVLPELDHVAEPRREPFRPGLAAGHRPRGRALGCKSVAFTYNDPIILVEYAIDVAPPATRPAGQRPGGHGRRPICPEPRRSSTATSTRECRPEGLHLEPLEEISGRALQPVLDTLVYLKKRTNVWLEITSRRHPLPERLGPEDNREMSRWVVEKIGPDTHRCTFPPFIRTGRCATCRRRHRPRSRGPWRIARAAGVRHAYTGNIDDPAGESTFCYACGNLLIGRDRYDLTAWNLTEGRCGICRTPLPGVFADAPGKWGSRRRPVRLQDFAA